MILFLPKIEAFFFYYYSFVYSTSLFFYFSFFLPQYKRHKSGLGVRCLFQYLCQFVRGVWWLWQNKYLTSYPCYSFASSTLFSYSALAINVLNSWSCCVSSWAEAWGTLFLFISLSFCCCLVCFFASFWNSSYFSKPILVHSVHVDMRKNRIYNKR